MSPVVAYLGLVTVGLLACVSYLVTLVVLRWRRRRAASARVVLMAQAEVLEALAAWSEQPHLPEARRGVVLATDLRFQAVALRTLADEPEWLSDDR